MKFVCISCFDYYNVRTREILEYFEGKNFQVEYIIPDFNHFSQEKSKIQFKNTRLIHVPAYYKNISFNRIYSHYKFSKGVYDELNKIQPDIIYCMLPPNFLTREIIKYKNKFKCRVIFDVYDLWPESMPVLNNKIFKIPFNLWRNLRDKYINEADLIICVSKFTEEFLKNIHADLNSKILYPSIYDEDKNNFEIPERKFNIDNPENEITFCHLGNINHIVDTELALKILGGLTKYKRVKINLIGSGLGLKKFVDDLEKNNIQVIQHGVIFDMAEKIKIYNSSDLGLCVPKVIINSAMPLKAAEYIKCGLPFVNNSLGDMRDLVENFKIGINYNNVDDVINKILKLTREDLINMSRNCKLVYKKYFMHDFDELFKNFL